MAMNTVDAYTDWTRRVAICAAEIANYADHAEHNESVDPRWVLDAADELRAIASEIASAEDVDLFQLYARRLGTIEARNALGDGELVGRREAEAATTWRELQLAQVTHDRLFHPDVLGLMKSQQLQHYALHVIKIAGALARRSTRESASDEIIQMRLPDMLLFAVKLHTVMNVRMADASLARSDASAPKRLAAV